MPRFRPGDVGGRHLRQRQRQRLDDEVVDRELVGARAVLGRRGVHALAGAQQFVDAAVDRQMEVRDGLLRQRQALGDDLAHAVVRDDVVGALLVERQDLVVRHAAAARMRRAAASAATAVPALARRRAPPFCERRLDVALDDAPVRAGARERRKVEPGLLGEPARQRRGEDAAVPVGRLRTRRRAPAPPLGLGDGRRPLAACDPRAARTGSAAGGARGLHAGRCRSVAAAGCSLGGGALAAAPRPRSRPRPAASRSAC